MSGIISAGILPAAIEMMDRLAIEAAKAATGLDWPDVGAALLMDADGTKAEVEHVSTRAIEVRLAQTGLTEPRARCLPRHTRTSSRAYFRLLHPAWQHHQGVAA